MTKLLTSPRRWHKGAWLILLIVLGGTSVWLWREKQWRDDMVAPAMILINYTGEDVEASLEYGDIPDSGARDAMGPYSGGSSVSCCVPMPTHWRPGIKMLVKYNFGNWPRGLEKTKIVELPDYPDGRPGYLFVLVHSETDIEVLSSIYGPLHERWPGRVKGYPYEPSNRRES